MNLQSQSISIPIMLWAVVTYSNILKETPHCLFLFFLTKIKAAAARVFFFTLTTN